MSLILHHYDFSNFSEKVRLILGFKGLTWQSVEIPSHLPKPDYTPLTAGYRRTPALQIGADIYCDTSLIAREIENRYPHPSLFGETAPARTQATSECLAHWAESALLWPVALYITGVHADKFPETFHLDRARLHNKPSPTIEQVKRAGKNYFSEMCMQLARIEALLTHDEAYLLGAELTLADFIVYGAPWLLETVGGPSEIIDELPRTRAWMGRLAAVGHGEIAELSAEQAIEHANESTCAPLPTHSSPPETLVLGDEVTVSPRDEYSPSHGQLVCINDEQIIIRANNDRVVGVHVHFPRLGYRVSQQKKPTG